MNKADLIEAVFEGNSLSRTEAKKAVDTFFEEMAQALVKGDRVEIRGLCTFHVKDYKSYTGRNPKTGAKVVVKKKKLPVFKPGEPLKKRLNGQSTGRTD